MLLKAGRGVGAGEVLGIWVQPPCSEVLYFSHFLQIAHMYLYPGALESVTEEEGSDQPVRARGAGVDV